MAQQKSSGNPHRVDNSLKMFDGSYVSDQAAGQHTIILGKIPYSNIWVQPQLSIFGASQYASGAQGHLGYRYVDPDTGEEVSSFNFWLDNVALGTAATAADLLGDIVGVAAGGLVPAANHFRSVDGVQIEYMVDTANIPTGGSIDLFLFYAALR
jgi:hypothetical protein